MAKENSSNQNDELAESILARLSDLEGARSTWQSHWDEIARVVSPRDEEFFRQRTPGEKRTENMYDSTAPLALGRFASVMDSLFTPRDQTYQRLQANIPELMKVDNVRVWFDSVTDAIFKMRYNPRAGFAGQMVEVWRSTGAFGTSPMMVNDKPGFGTTYKTMHLSNAYITESESGLIDSIYIKVNLTVKQAVQRYGKENLPEAVLGKINSQPNEKIEFVQFIGPNDDFDPESNASDKMKFRSIHVAVMEKKIVKKGGFRVFPVPVSRAETSPNEIYGRSPAMIVLPNIKMLNQMKKSNIRMAHKNMDPIILMKDDGAINRADMRPGHVIVGGLDANGEPNVQPYNPGGNLVIDNEMMEIERATIERSFLNDIFIMAQDREMTATEVMHRAKEQAMLLSSFSGKQESEFLSQLIEIEMDNLQVSGKLPPMPPELIEAEGEWEAVYTGPTARSRKAEEAIGSQQVFQAAIEASNFIPEILDKVNGDEYLEIIREAGGAPNKLLNSDEEVAEIRELRNQAELEQQDAENIQGVTQAGLNVAKVQEMAGAE